MAASLGYVLSQLQRWTSSDFAELSDTVLLERFVQRHDESAFAALVSRHGAMVLRSCRRILGDAHRAEDAFQTTFLILARKAHTLRQPAALPGFLHSVARRVALQARNKVALRSAERSATAEELPDSRPDPLAQLTARELLAVVDDEVRRLPAAQRSAVILCCLEGQTREEAAGILGCTLGSLKGHLERGRKRLQERLARRGIALPAALAIVAVSRGEGASVLLLRSTVAAALSDGIGSSAASLANSVLKTMFLTKFAAVMSVVLTVALAASTTVAVVYRGSATKAPEEETPAVLAAPTDAAADKRQARTDALGDPLPAGAVARLGTVRLRHGDRISMVRFTPDGKRLISQAADGVRVWDAATGKELRHLPEARGDFRGSDLTPDGKLAAAPAGPPDFPLELWDVDRGKKIITIGDHFSLPIRFSPDGKLLAAASTSNSVDIWDVSTRKKICAWQAHEMPVRNMVFSVDGRRLLTCPWSRPGVAGAGPRQGIEIRCWDATTGRKLQEFKPLNGAPAGDYNFNLRFALSADGKLLAMTEANEEQKSSSGKTAWKACLSLWDAASGKVIRKMTCDAYEIVAGERVPFRDLTFTPDGKTLIASGPDHSVRFWDVDSGKELRRLPLDGMPDSLTLSKDGQKLAVVMGNGAAICILDLKSGRPTMPAGGHLMAVTLAALAPDGRSAVTGHWLDSLLVWDVAAGRVRRQIEGHNGPVLTLQLSSDGRTLLTSGWDKTLRIWDFAAGLERRRINLEGALAMNGEYRGFAATADGKTVAVMNAKTIRIFDAASGAERQHFRGPEGLLSMGLSSNGRSLITWSNDLKVRVWDTATGRQRREHSLPVIYDGVQPPPNPDEYYNAALSPDGRLLAMGPRQHRPPAKASQEKKNDSTLILKDLETGQIVHKVEKLPSETALFAFSPDGRMLAWTGGYNDTAIRLLETASGRERRCLAGHRGRIAALAFSADGRRLLSGSEDTTALVWDLTGDASKSAPAADLERLWADLAADDAVRAYRAIHRLAASPSSAIPFIKERLRPAVAVDEKRLARLIVDLDSDDFAARQKAGKDLAKLGEQALSAYRKALEGKPSLEARRRLEDLLDKAQVAWWDVSGERLRSLRAVEVLELAGTQEARQWLKTLAEGAAGTRLTEEAKAALERLANRASNTLR
jgi:RNA polymerase sigma factor (sigma-70 family)